MRDWGRAIRRGGWLATLAALLWAASVTTRADEPTDGMPVSDVRIEGLDTLSEAYVRRIITTLPGQPYSRRQVEEDVRALLRTRKFLNAFAQTDVHDGRVAITFQVQEKPCLVAVELSGNKRFTNVELYEDTPVPGTPLDLYATRRAAADMLEKYRRAGYYYATVELDENTLQREGRALYRITEGPRVKVRNVEFEGNRYFGRPRLRMIVESKTYIWLFRTGALDEDQAERDALGLQQFYRDEGFLDARVDYRLDFDPIERADVNLVFVIEEGPRYRVNAINVEGNEVFPASRIAEVMRLQPGGVLREEARRTDASRIRDLYGEIGYVETGVAIQPEFTEQPDVVNVRVTVVEGNRSRFGRITIRGNQRTRDEVVRRELRFFPGEYYNTVEARAAARRVQETGLFRQGSVTIVPLDDVQGYREALVTVEETETTQFLVGVGVSTDNGILGSLSIDNRNFDIADWPRSWREFFSARAFRGDGQRLVFQAEPGTEVSRFRIAFTEPYLADKPLRLDTSVYLFQRGREAYDEERLGLTLGLSKRFYGGVLDGWAIEGAGRIEAINIDSVDPFAAREIREAKGNHVLTALKAGIVRDTTDSRILPSEGYRLGFSWEQVGALGGDYSFGKPAISFATYRTVRTDILDRKSILAFRADAAWIVNDGPVFERYYGGGYGSLRGFSFRGVSPRRGIYDNPVGGNFIMLAGGEYSFPLYGKTFRGVTFLDMGTVEESFELTGWRASVGFGLRVQVDFFGPVPIVFDFGFPIAQDDDDDMQVFNFAFGASF